LASRSRIHSCLSYRRRGRDLGPIKILREFSNLASARKPSHVERVRGLRQSNPSAHREASHSIRSSCHNHDGPYSGFGTPEFAATAHKHHNSYVNHNGAVCLRNGKVLVAISAATCPWRGWYNRHVSIACYRPFSKAAMVKSSETSRFSS